MAFYLTDIELLRIDGEMKKWAARAGGQDTDIDAVLRLQIQADTAALR